MVNITKDESGAFKFQIVTPSSRVLLEGDGAATTDEIKAIVDDLAAAIEEGYKLNI